MSVSTLLLLAGAWSALLGLMLAMLVVARRADEVTARQLGRRPASTQGGETHVPLPSRAGRLRRLRRSLPVYAPLLAGILAGSVVGVFAGAMIVNAVKRTQSPAPVPRPWVAPEPATRAPAPPPLDPRHPAPLTKSVSDLGAMPKTVRPARTTGAGS